MEIKLVALEEIRDEWEFVASVKLTISVAIYFSSLRLVVLIGVLQAKTMFSLGVTTIEMHLGISLAALPNFFVFFGEEGLIGGGGGGQGGGGLSKDRQEMWKMSGLLRYVLILREVKMGKERDNFGGKGGENLLNTKRLENMLKSLNEGLEQFKSVLKIVEECEKDGDGELISCKIKINSLIYCGVLHCLKDGKYHNGNKYFEQCSLVLMEMRDESERLARKLATRGLGVENHENKVKIITSR